jgi:hypothetical protein
VLPTASPLAAQPTSLLLLPEVVGNRIAYLVWHVAIQDWYMTVLVMALIVATQDWCKTVLVIALAGEGCQLVVLASVRVSCN